MAGINGLVQGFFQGQQLRQDHNTARDQAQERQQKIAHEQFTDAVSAAPYYQQLAREYPEMAKTDAFRNSVNKQLAPIGVNFKDGLPPGFGNMDPAEFVTHPEALQTLASLQPNLRSIVKPALGETFGGAGGEFYTRAAQATPKEIKDEIASVDREMVPYQNGNFSPDNPQYARLRAIRQFYASKLPSGDLPPELAGPEPSAPTGGYKVANATSLADSRKTAQQLAREKFDQKKVVDEAKLGGIRAATAGQLQKNAWYPRVEQGIVDNRASLIAERKLNMDFLPQKQQIELDRAADSHKRAEDNHTKTVQVLKSFSAMGTTPQAVAMYSSVTKSLRDQANNDRTAKDTANNFVQAILKDNFGSPPRDPQIKAIFDSQLELAKRYGDRYEGATAAAHAMEANQQVFARKALSMMGAPASMSPVPSVNQPLAPGSGDNETIARGVKIFSTLPYGKALSALRAMHLPQSTYDGILRGVRDAATPPATP